MSDAKTPPEVIDALQRMATRNLSPADLQGQRISFAMNAVSDEAVTREQVEQLVSDQTRK